VYTHLDILTCKPASDSKFVRTPQLSDTLYTYDIPQSLSLILCHNTQLCVHILSCVYTFYTLVRDTKCVHTHTTVYCDTQHIWIFSHPTNTQKCVRLKVCTHTWIFWHPMYLYLCVCMWWGERERERLCNISASVYSDTLHISKFWHPSNILTPYTSEYSDILQIAMFWHPLNVLTPCASEYSDILYVSIFWHLLNVRFGHPIHLNILTS